MTIPMRAALGIRRLTRESALVAKPDQPPDNERQRDLAHTGGAVVGVVVPDALAAKLPATPPREPPSSSCPRDAP